MMCDKSVVITDWEPEGTAADKVMIDCLYFVPVSVCERLYRLAHITTSVYECVYQISSHIMDTFDDRRYGKQLFKLWKEKRLW